MLLAQAESGAEMSYKHPRCPVCLQQILLTEYRNIRQHLDSLELDTCPGSGLPHYVALTVHQPDGAATVRRAS